MKNILQNSDAGSANKSARSEDGSAASKKDQTTAGGPSYAGKGYRSSFDQGGRDRSYSRDQTRGRSAVRGAGRGNYRGRGRVSKHSLCYIKLKPLRRGNMLIC